MVSCGVCARSPSIERLREQPAVSLRATMLCTEARASRGGQPENTAASGEADDEGGKVAYDVVGERAQVRDTFMQAMVKQVESMQAAAKDTQEKLNDVKKIPNHEALFRDMLPVIELRTQALVHLMGSVPQHHCRHRSSVRCAGNRMPVRSRGFQASASAQSTVLGGRGQAVISTSAARSASARLLRSSSLLSPECTADPEALAAQAQVDESKWRAFRQGNQEMMPDKALATMPCVVELMREGSLMAGDAVDEKTVNAAARPLYARKTALEAFVQALQQNALSSTASVLIVCFTKRV